MHSRIPSWTLINWASVMDLFYTVQLWIFQNTDKLYQYGTLTHCAIMDIPEHWKLYQHGTLINCAIMDIHKHWWMMPLWDTNGLCNYGHICKHHAVLWLWILIMHRNSKANGISLKLRNVYGQYAHINVTEHSYQNDQYSYEFHCNIGIIIMYNYQIYSIYKWSKGYQ